MGTGGVGAGCSHTPQRQTPQCWSPGDKTKVISHVLCNNSTPCHSTSQESEYYRVIELDGSDVVLGQGDAAILRMDEQESLREENDFP